MTSGQMTEDPRKAGIPAFLQTQNRTALTAKQAARLAEVQSRASAEVPTYADTRKRLSDALEEDKAAALAKLKRFGELKRGREQSQGKWVPGCSWDVKNSRWVHPAAKWNGTKWVSKTEVWTEVPAAAQPGEGNIAMSKSTKKKASPKAANGGGRDVSRAPGLVADFRRIREGTARHTVVVMGVAGRHTTAEIAKKIGKSCKGYNSDHAMVMNYLFCLGRDCAYGYEITGGKVKIRFPGSKTIKDAVKVAAKAA